MFKLFNEKIWTYSATCFVGFGVIDSGDSGQRENGSRESGHEK